MIAAWLAGQSSGLTVALILWALSAVVILACLITARDADPDTSQLDEWDRGGR